MASTENKLNGTAHDADEIIEKTGKQIASKSEKPEETTNTAAEPAEVTKRSLRVQTWRKMQDSDSAVYPFFVFNCIPNFVGAEKAANLLAETPEFIDAKNVKIDNDRSQDAIKLHAIATSKNLYISPGRRSNALFSKINCLPEEITDVKKKAILVKNLSEYGTEIDFKSTVQLDLLILGSVAVSKIGQRIGRGNGYIDLDFAILKNCYAITDETIIVTVVHDEQIYETLPEELFTSYDVPVDLIVTPTTVHRVAKCLPRPAGIQWNILSERRLEIIPVLKLIKVDEEKNGKIIVLKSEDTDVETNRKPRRYRPFIKRTRKISRNNTENNGDANDENVSPRPRRRFYRNHKKQKKTDDGGDQSSNEKRSSNKMKKRDGVENGSEPIEVTKRSVRMQTWKKISDKRCVAFPYLIFNRVPNFIGAAKAADLLSELDEFKNAKTIKVNSDKSQDPVKLKVISESKDLYVAAARDSKALYTKINCASDAEPEIKKKSIRTQYLSEYGADIEFKDKVELDMLVIGAVAVSKSGQRIGRGNGYVDLDFGILVDAGAVTDKTIIVATVHNEQVFDTLPEELFTEYDVPVDIIVTPTEVIRVEKRRQRPKGIYWHLLSERRIKIVAVLKTIKENMESTGKIIVLKEDDTDVESLRKLLKSKKQKHYYRFRKNTNTSVNNGELTDEKTTPRHRRRFQRRYKKSKVSSGAVTTDGEQSASEKKTRQTKKRRDNRDFCIKVSNIPKTIRVKEFKTELRERGCNPIFISWKGSYGMCYLHFGKQGGNGDQEAAIAKMINTLDNLSLTDPTNKESNNGPDSKLKIEVVKRTQENRIETVEVSSV